MKVKAHSLHRDSQSSISSLSPSDALNRPTKSGRIDWDSDTGGPSRRVPLNRRSVSPMAPGFRVHPGRPASGSSSATSSDRGLLSPPLTGLGGMQTHDVQGWGRVDIPDSPPLASPPAPRTPITISPLSNSTIRVIDSEHPGSEMSSDSPPDPSDGEKILNKITPLSQYQAEDTSDSSVVEVPSRSPRLRSKRWNSRPPNLNIPNTAPRSQQAVERKLSDPNSLGVEWPTDDHDVVSTPRASTFNVDEPTSNSPSRSLRRSRKVSGEGQGRQRKTSVERPEIRPRKVSTGRTRKTSDDGKEFAKRRESSAEEGDDEGYDDLLSAYESEDNPLP